MILPTEYGLWAIGLGLLAAAWRQVQGGLKRVWGLVFVNAQVENMAAVALRAYCWDQMTHAKLGPRRFTGDTEHVRPVGRHQVVAYETVGTESKLFWQGWRPLMVRARSNKEYTERAEESSGTPAVILSIVTLRGAFDIEALIQEAVSTFNKLQHGHQNQGIPAPRRFRVERVIGYRRVAGMAGGNDPSGRPMLDGPSSVNIATSSSRPLGWNREDIGPPVPAFGAKALDLLALPDDALGLIKEVRRWKASEGWYRERGIPWRWGWQLSGRPGTGKTALSRAIAQDLDLPVWIYDLATLTNSEMQAAWARMLAESPCMALIEDVDCVFEGRENKLGESGGGLTFDCLLDCLGGFVVAHGVLAVVTTNRPESLDPALGVATGNGATSTRPGRLDRALTLTELGHLQRLKLAKRILPDLDLTALSRLVDAGHGDTGAQFQDRCATVALQAYWDNDANPRRDSPADDGELAPTLIGRGLEELGYVIR